MTPSEQLANEIAQLLDRHGRSGGWVLAEARDEGPLFATVVVIDAASQKTFAITVEELLGQVDA